MPERCSSWKIPAAKASPNRTIIVSRQSLAANFSSGAVAVKSSSLAGFVNVYVQTCMAACMSMQGQGALAAQPFHLLA